MSACRVLLLSAYHAASHRRWCQELMGHFNQWQWVLESLPARYFSWRFRGNSLTWGMGDHPSLDADYDMLVATSMVDLTSLRGLRPHLAGIPTLVYCHENQFAYPDNQQQQGHLERQLTSIYTALAADQLVFNSAHNRDSFLAGAHHLLRAMPDGVPSGLQQRLASRSQVLPVPLTNEFFTPVSNGLQKPPGEVVELLWNHRWEWDKGPDRLLLLVQLLAQRGLLGSRFRLHVVGEQFRSYPKEFDQIKTLLQRHGALGRWGFVACANDYRQLMVQCHGVLSTATHDFQGLALLEAALSGCVPLVPDRLAYPEWFTASFRYPSYINDRQREAEELADLLLRLFPTVAVQSAWPRRRELIHELSLSPFHQLSWRNLGPAYQASFDALHQTRTSR